MKRKERKATETNHLTIFSFDIDIKNMTSKKCNTKVGFKIFVTCIYTLYIIILQYKMTQSTKHLRISLLNPTTLVARGPESPGPGISDAAKTWTRSTKKTNKASIIGKWWA